MVASLGFPAQGVSVYDIMLQLSYHIGHRVQMQQSCEASNPDSASTVQDHHLVNVVAPATKAMRCAFGVCGPQWLQLLFRGWDFEALHYASSPAWSWCKESTSALQQPCSSGTPAAGSHVQALTHEQRNTLQVQLLAGASSSAAPAFKVSRCNVTSVKRCPASSRSKVPGRLWWPLHLCSPSDMYPASSTLAIGNSNFAVPRMLLQGYCSRASRNDHPVYTCNVQCISLQSARLQAARGLKSVYLWQRRQLVTTPATARRQAPPASPTSCMMPAAAAGADSAAVADTLNADLCDSDDNEDEGEVLLDDTTAEDKRQWSAGGVSEAEWMAGGAVSPGSAKQGAEDCATDLSLDSDSTDEFDVEFDEAFEFDDEDTVADKL